MKKKGYRKWISSRAVRLKVYKSNKHFYAQIIENGQVIAAASTLEKNLEKVAKSAAAILVGELIGKRGIEKTVGEVALDRSGFKYHGNIKLLANSARKQGLIF